MTKKQIYRAHHKKVRMHLGVCTNNGCRNIATVGNLCDGCSARIRNLKQSYMKKSLFKRILTAYERGAPIRLSAGDVGSIRKFIRGVDCIVESGFDARVSNGREILEMEERDKGRQ